MKSEVTVIICTYNRGDLLPETLPSIINQNIPKSRYRIIVVNNNSNDSTNEVLLSFKKNNSNMSIINEAQQGLSYARNTGYRHSSTEWIIYLDDDAIVPSNFIEIALKIIETKNYDCFGGIYYPWYRYGKPIWYKDIYASTAEFYKQNNGHKLQYASGGIMAIKRSLLIDFNGFPENIGMKGNMMAYGEETFLQKQIYKAGYSIGILPEWQMNHIVNKYKLKPFWFIKNGYVTGKDAWIIYNEKVSLKLIIKYFIKLFIDLFKNIYKNIKLLTSNEYYVQNWVIETFRPAALDLGRVIAGINALAKK